MKKFFLRVSHHPQGLTEAQAGLLQGNHRHDIIEQGIRVLESDESDDSVGFGGFPNVLGEMELDAAFMDGDTRNFGGIAGVTRFLPVRIARRLMERQVHTFLTGTGAELFAAACGFAPEPTLSERQRQEWERRVKPLLEKFGPERLYALVEKLADPKNKNLDTTVMIAHDGNGLSGGASTSGWPYKHPGRVGDTPIAGAGLYVDSRYGACACTWTGEMSMRASTARLVVEHLKLGKTPKEAALTAIEDLMWLKGGVSRCLVIHILDAYGNEHVTAVNSDKVIPYHYWCEGMAAPELRNATPYT
jgi:isoaspartyl peptidase/L-asparaginase-like protein (Ntn-hydrolase superfamily)